MICNVPLMFSEVRFSENPEARLPSNDAPAPKFGDIPKYSQIN